MISYTFKIFKSYVLQSLKQTVVGKYGEYLNYGICNELVRRVVLDLFKQKLWPEIT